jgi:hypothetical protein
MPETELIGRTGFGSNRKEKVPPKEKKTLRLHAPTTLCPSNLDDNTVLKHASDLLNTQEQIVAAAKSPTRRISDHEFYCGNHKQSPTTHYLQTLEPTLESADAAVPKDVRETIKVLAQPKPHLTSIELLHSSRWRAQNLLSRSEYSRIKQRMEQELKSVEDGLRVKLEGVQVGIDEDVSTGAYFLTAILVHVIT